MAQYINKTAVVAEIERKKIPFKKDIDDGVYPTYLCALMDFEDFINTLEVKEVDNIWHDASETPKGAGDKEILVRFTDSHASVLEIDDWEYLDHQVKWAYLKDLI